LLDLTYACLCTYFYLSIIILSVVFYQGITIHSIQLKSWAILLFVGGSTLYPLNVSIHWQFDAQCLIFSRWPPWSCIRVPPLTFRPHARHFRRKSCHMQRTVTFNTVYIPKLPPTSSNPLHLYCRQLWGDLLAYFLSSPTPKQTIGAGEIRFRSPAIADNATV